MVDKASDFLKSYWPMIAGVLAAAAAWGTLTAQQASMIKQQDVFNAGQIAIALKLDRIGEDVATTSADARNATNNIADLRRRVGTLEARR